MKLCVNDDSMASPDNSEPVIDRVAFEAYKQLRAIAKKYDVEDRLEVPQIVLVGETSTGKSMLVQNFLRFPCSFSQTGIATRCPVAYRLVYNPTLPIGELRIIRPAGITAAQLANHLEKLMKNIQEECIKTGGFRLEPEWIEIESAEYTDFEIIDLPGLVGGDKVAENRQAVEKIAESFVRNPRFSIVLLKETTQITDNSHGARVIDELCTRQQSLYSSLPPRPNYRDSMITIHTKFDSFMLNFTNGAAVNNEISKQLKDFGPSFFTNMIFDGYSMSKRSFEDNVAYLRGLSHRERQEIDTWIGKLNQNNNQPPHYYESFDQRYRQLIGIDVVRNQIQSLWLKSFRSALPKLKTCIQEELDKTKSHHEEAQKRYKLLDPSFLRDTYKEYLGNFYQIISEYVSYKSEVDHFFSIDRCGKTYEQIESAYNDWNRKKKVTWRAYLSTNQLRQQFSEEKETIDVRMVGARHFVRLHNFFSYMVLSFKPREPTREWVESTTSSLTSGTADFEETEKSVREIVRTLIRETFLMGIVWLTQMCSYLMDMFKTDVKTHLLSDQKYPILRDHHAFLNAVDLEYHIIVRRMIHDAVRVIHGLRHSVSAYVHYDISKRLSKLMLSIPREIEHESFTQPIDGIFVRNSSNNEYKTATLTDIFKAVPPHKLLEEIYGSESFLTEKRNSYTCSHHDNARRVIKELYVATCGRLLEEARSSFNTYVVMKIHHFLQLSTQKHPENPKRISLSARIDRMTEREIINMSNLGFDEIRIKCRTLMEKIAELNEGLLFINNAIAEMNSDQFMRNDERRLNVDSILYKKTKHEEYIRTQEEAVEKRHMQYSLAKTNHDETNNDSKEVFNDENADDEQILMSFRDPASAAEFLRDIYDKHDKDDLTYGFCENDPKDQDVDYFEKNSSSLDIADMALPNPSSQQLITTSPRKDNVMTNISYSAKRKT